MTRLALLAVLLMALAPTVSRLLANDRGTDGWAALCTTMGLTWARAADASIAGKPSPTGSDRAMGGDCGYCQLLHSLPLVLLFLGLLVPRLAAGRVAFHEAPSLRARPNRRGLGGQGPPIFL